MATFASPAQVMMSYLFKIFYKMCRVEITEKHASDSFPLMTQTDTDVTYANPLRFAIQPNGAMQKSYSSLSHIDPGINIHLLNVEYA